MNRRVFDVDLDGVVAEEHLYRACLFDYLFRIVLQDARVDGQMS